MDSSVKQHKAKLNSFLTDAFLMLCGETSGIETKCLCRTVLLGCVGFFFCICLFLSKEGVSFFRAVFFTVFFANAKVNQQRCETAAKIEFPSKISMLKHFPFESILVCNPPAALLCLYHPIHKPPWWIRVLKKPVLKHPSLPNHCFCSDNWLVAVYTSPRFLTLWCWTSAFTIAV